MRGCIVGLGSIGSRHLRNLEFLGVNDLVVLRRHGNPAYTTTHPVVSSHAEALAAKPDFAVICSPTSMHVSDALPFLQAGVPTLIEKPLTSGPPPAVASADEWVSFPAYMAYCLRYHPAYAKARKLVTSGVLGVPLYAKAWNESYLPYWHPKEDWKQSYAACEKLGGGLPRTLDHEVDFLNWCFGESRGTIGRVWNSGSDEALTVPDCAILTIDYPGGVVASCTLSMSRRRRSRGFEIVTDWGALCYDWDCGLLRFYPSLSDEDMHSKTHWQFGNYEINQMYTDMMQDFLLAVEGRENTTPTIADGFDSLRTMEGDYA